MIIIIFYLLQVTNEQLLHLLSECLVDFSYGSDSLFHRSVAVIGQKKGETNETGLEQSVT